MKELEEAAEFQKELSLTILEDCDDDLAQAVSEAIKKAYIAGANYAIKNAWQKADGDYLPEIDREVIALQKCEGGYRVVFAHRPPEFWDGKNIITGKVTRNYPKTYDKGGWNIPDVKYWLDLDLPKNEKE